ncbi:MAG: phytanoyl-CoA dioxygenase family protein [Candidatus Velthaea sp.]
MISGRLDETTIEARADEVRRSSYCVLRNHVDRALLAAWSEAFVPLLEANVRANRGRENRGAERYYVTLPFRGVFADPRIAFDPDVLALCERLVGPDMVMCQLASDTPLRGSDMQEVHRDAPPLFAEWGRETPPFQLAVNIPLVDVTAENGPTEIAAGTHVLAKDEGLARIAAGEIPLEPLYLSAGDVVVRDVRHLHRGTPNTTDVPRPMIVIGFSRRWLRRPEVSIRVPESTWSVLDAAQRRLLRFEPVVPDDAAESATEVYQAFAY